MRRNPSVLLSHMYPAVFIVKIYLKFLKKNPSGCLLLEQKEEEPEPLVACSYRFSRCLQYCLEISRATVRQKKKKRNTLVQNLASSFFHFFPSPARLLNYRYWHGETEEKKKQKKNNEVTRGYRQCSERTMPRLNYC